MEGDNYTYQQLIEECQSLRQEIELCRNSSSTIEESTSSLNALINNQEASIWSIDSQYNYVIFNNHFKDAYLQAFGLKIKKGLNSLDVLDHELKEFWKEKYDQALNGQQIDFEFTNKADNKDFIFNVSLNPVISNGIVIGVAALSVDVTQQKCAANILAEKNANMLSIMDNTLESIWAINTSYEILFTNSVFKNEFYHSFGVMLEKGVNLLESLPDALRPIWKKRYDRALSNERFSFVDAIDVGDKIFYVEVSMNPMLHDEKVIGASFFANDITERKAAEDALIENEHRLKELNSTKDKFFSIIAHDLKSPFNSIVGLSDLLVVEAEKGNDISEIARIAQKSSHQAMDLISNLLEWSRTQSGKIDYNPEYFEVCHLLNQEIKAHNTYSRLKNITINNLIANHTLAHADKYMISCVFRNLLSNAIKFSHQGGEVNISSSKNDKYISFSIIDNGIGIDDDDINKLFVIDQNHSTPGTKNEQGTGLGLILCKEFIEMHNGRIWVNTKNKKGSEFCFSLPIISL
ncbi:sensor histidine kinase [Carboxylicivirga marina]|uniref:sensor histidine kinase n=1 Tax=Carboxylicivirga marina TaxID=2800988 RepID=UPI002598EDC4|nr:PAS domain-containing sensor histidine kinase [uncultured Carboxylicivirga sp.]